MADSLTLQIGVDTTALTAKLAQAQADVRAYAAEVSRLINELHRADGPMPLSALRWSSILSGLTRAYSPAASARRTRQSDYGKLLPSFLSCATRTCVASNDPVHPRTSPGPCAGVSGRFASVAQSGAVSRR